MIACSALTGRGVPKLLERAIQLADRRASRIGTSELNRFVGDLVATRPPPSKRGRRLRLYYAAQVDRRPPRFAIQVNDRRLISREWAFHLENRLREAYALEGVPLVIDFVPHSRRARPRSGTSDEVSVAMRQVSRYDHDRRGSPACLGLGSRRHRGCRRSFERIARAPAEAGRELWERWLGLSIYTRRRLGLAAGVLAVIALVWFAAVPALPCGAPGGDTCSPADTAIDLVPDDALVYAHFNPDAGSGSYQAAQGLAAQMPTLAQQAIGRLTSVLPGPHGRALDFARDVGPWFGGEAALGILPAGRRSAQEVELLEVADSHGATEFADSLTGGHPRTATKDGVEIEIGPRGLATSLVGGFLAIGTTSGVRQVIDAHNAAGGARSLADDAGAGRGARHAVWGPPGRPVRLQSRNQEARRRARRCAGQPRPGPRSRRQRRSRGRIDRERRRTRARDALDPRSRPARPSTPGPSPHCPRSSPRSPARFRRTRSATSGSASRAGRSSRSCEARARPRQGCSR